MLLLLLITVLGLRGLITAEDNILVHGHLGSNLLLPVEAACRINAQYTFDIYNGTERIGAYHQGLQGLKSYNGRLKYDQQNCTITLKNLSEWDGTKFTVILGYVIDGRSATYDINYTVIISTGDPRTTDPPHVTTSGRTVRNESQVSTDGNLSFVSFCLSLDSGVNALFTLLLLIRQGFCEMLEQDSVNFGCQINCCFTVIFQILSTSIRSSGMSYTWLLLAIPIILLVDILEYFGRLPGRVLAPITAFKSRFPFSCCNIDESSRYKQMAPYICTGFLLLIQVLFSVFVAILHYKSDDDISRRASPSNAYVVIAVVLDLVLKIGVFFIVYCSKTKCNEFKQVSSEEPKPAPGDPGSFCQPSV